MATHTPHFEQKPANEGSGSAWKRLTERIRTTDQRRAERVVEEEQELDSALRAARMISEIAQPGVLERARREMESALAERGVAEKELGERLAEWHTAHPATPFSVTEQRKGVARILLHQKRYENARKKFLVRFPVPFSYKLWQQLQRGDREIGTSMTGKRANEYAGAVKALRTAVKNLDQNLWIVWDRYTNTGRTKDSKFTELRIEARAPGEHKGTEESLRLVPSPEQALARIERANRLGREQQDEEDAETARKFVSKGPQQDQSR